MKEESRLSDPGAGSLGRQEIANRNYFVIANCNYVRLFHRKTSKSKPAMPRLIPHSKNGPSTSLSVKIDGWFEARATGWGVAAVPLLLVLLARAAASHIALR